MTEALPKVDRQFLSILVRGAEETFDNAEQLYFEAEILAKAGATARALCLHQISLEECSKVENIGAWATSLLSGLPVDQNKVLASFRRHSSKNKSNAYMLEGSQAEKHAKARGDWKAVRKEFKKLQMEFHEASNDAKNGSLYPPQPGGESRGARREPGACDFLSRDTAGHRRDRPGAARPYGAESAFRA
ncbi:AbiV family abortive infection protein [Methylocystis sp. L43]|jgi:AbiV family abortive infection protein|uniref:AbiV family abortive infection protein n=1 Tax=Methylocystis rosea TaxID=173366 RepID=A0ABX6EN73_9HYPH|nr:MULTISPECIES: AbiV family abortive infection protein [Methylocystis]MBG0797009.1 AbiV family abortive infection protein [Methylocystis sp. L43]MBG0804855.1 AbiV family abortive infection protein [Methylocystis sp. H15]PPD10243.1 MAG: hypothetical protein CTY36_00705 [Methylocystis sp.]QGM95754.1 AbiV family abortive infection protein [Methylocystis rosea]